MWLRTLPSSSSSFFVLKGGGKRGRLRRNIGTSCVRKRQQQRHVATTATTNNHNNREPSNASFTPYSVCDHTQQSITLIFCKKQGKPYDTYITLYVWTPATTAATTQNVTAIFHCQKITKRFVLSPVGSGDDPGRCDRIGKGAHERKATGMGEDVIIRMFTYLSPVSHIVAWGQRLPQELRTTLGEEP